jgi:hypothetical protein
MIEIGVDMPRVNGLLEPVHRVGSPPTCIERQAPGQNESCLARLGLRRPSQRLEGLFDLFKAILDDLATVDGPEDEVERQMRRLQGPRGVVTGRVTLWEYTTRSRSSGGSATLVRWICS